MLQAQPAERNDLVDTIQVAMTIIINGKRSAGDDLNHGWLRMAPVPEVLVESEPEPDKYDGVPADTQA